MIEFVPESAKKVLEVDAVVVVLGLCSKKNDPVLKFGELNRARMWPEKHLKSWIKLSAELSKPASPNSKDQKFDCIVFNDVLEHLVNPEIALKDSKQYLSENGTVVASIPNILHFYQIWAILKDQDWKYEESGILDNTHLRFFTKKSILRLFENCGYEVTRLDGINPSYGHTFSIFRLFTLGHISDWKYVQFAIQAKSVIAI